MTKEQLIGFIRTKPTWNSNHVVEQIQNLELNFTAKYIPTTLQVGDIFFHSALNHPVMMLTDKLGVLTTTTNSEFNLCEIKSRFISGWITTTIIQVNVEAARKTFICLHDDRLQVHRIKKKLKSKLEEFSNTL